MQQETNHEYDKKKKVESSFGFTIQIRGVSLLNEHPGYDIKPSDGKAPIMEL